MIYGLLIMPGKHEILVNGGYLYGNSSEWTTHLYRKLAFHPRVTLTETIFTRFNQEQFAKLNHIYDPVPDIFFCAPSRLPSGEPDQALHPRIKSSTLRVLPTVMPFTRPGQVSPQEKTTRHRHVMDAFAWKIRQTFPKYQIPGPNLDWFTDFRQSSDETVFRPNQNYAIVTNRTFPNEYYPPFETGQDYIVIQVGTGYPEKTPIPTICNNFAQALIEQGENVVFLGPSPEYSLSARKELFDPVCKAHPRRAHNLVGKTKPAESLGLIQGAKAYFGGDTGLTHFASASGIPTISLFGGFTDHAVMGPYWHQKYVVQVKSTPPTCNAKTLIKKYHQAMARLTP